MNMLKQVIAASLVLVLAEISQAAGYCDYVDNLVRPDVGYGYASADEKHGG